MDYAVIGAVVGVFTSVALAMVVPTPLLVLVVIAAAIMGAAYRRFRSPWSRCPCPKQ